MAATPATPVTARRQDQPRQREGLKVAWALQLGSLRSQESTPLLVGDTLYVTSSHGPKNVFAVDARTGKLKWGTPPRCRRASTSSPAATSTTAASPTPTARSSSAGSTARWSRWTRRPARSCGRRQSSTTQQGSVITSPPTVVKNLVITGFGGGEYGARGTLRPSTETRQGGVAALDRSPAPASRATTPGRAIRWKHGGGVAWDRLLRPRR